MNIQSITPQNFNFTNPVYNKKSNNTNVIQSKYIHTLTADTVSFTGGPVRSLSKVSDHLEAQAAGDLDRLSRIATIYLDVLESVAFKLKEKGFSFDRVYCEQHPVKSPEAYVSKIVRSGNFKVPDTIRATLYCNDLYDLDSLNSLLLEMKKRGYVVADTEKSVKDLMKRGYIPTKAEAADTSIEKSVQDLDIRLEDVSEQITKLPKELKYSIGKPQKSGYEDIQIRFVREFDKKKKPILHELIVLFGPNYSKAKHEESSKIYDHLRAFEELHMKFEDKTIGSNSHKANRYMDLIKEMFRGKVSRKLYVNAKNKDLYDISDELPITFSKSDIGLYENYFHGLKEKLSLLYKDLIKSATSSESARKQLRKDQRSDVALINKIHDKLKESIAYYNYQNDLKK